MECDTDGEREMERHLYCRQGHSDGRKSKASESIRALSGVLVSRLPVALRIFATQRQLMDPAGRLYTHEINTQASASWPWLSAVRLYNLQSHQCPCTVTAICLPRCHLAFKMESSSSGIGWMSTTPTRVMRMLTIKRGECPQWAQLRVGVGFIVLIITLIQNLVGCLPRECFIPAN